MFTQEQTTFILESYFRNGQRLPNGEWNYSMEMCREEFRQAFPEDLINKNFSRDVLRIINNFRTTGSVKKQWGGGRSLVRTQNAVDNARNAIREQPTISVRRLAQQLDVSYGSCRNILKRNLHMHPYKVHVYQELLPPDYIRRVAYCRFFNANLNDDDVLDKTFFTDEAWFHLNGYVNAQNMRMWATENPHYYREAALHPVKVGVWCAMSRRRLIGPIFFEGNLNGERYRNNILETFINQLHDDELQFGFFQQDSARPHIAHETINYLQEFFDDRLISVNRFPPRSCDLTPLDYFLFPHLKNPIFSEPLHTVEDLRAYIERECELVDRRTLQNVFESMKRRVNLCLNVEGQHFQQLL